MAHTLTANEWGFSVPQDSPFAVFRYLQKIARESVGESNVIDLSRGDPGYGFTPSVRGRRFYGFLAMLDTHLNNGAGRFSIRTDGAGNEGITADIESFTRNSFSKELADALLADLEEFIAALRNMSKECGLEWTAFDVLKNIFSSCAVTGGTYLNPQGEEITRVVLAHWYRQFLPGTITHNDFIVFQGASHAIGTVFKALGKGGIGYLNPDDVVVISSPVYAPYNASLLNRGIKSFVLSVDPVTGVMSEESLNHLESLSNETPSGRLKAIILIDPNNPTGFSLADTSLQRIATIAKKHDCIVITDEVYISFFPRKKTLADYCPERLLRIDARSKIERSTGLRFGDMFISQTANDYLSGNILKKHLAAGQDLKSYLIQAKGPGGPEGELQHTTFVPGPSQFMGIAHMVLGGKEREKYLEDVK
ncbi:MAG TPA: pyridoxal phosphate-dependent aminotransferase, partial [Candidatus Gracilibacteria bacterium]|nr:pyridoxal phosphate-dependent aminotransferase [Candidatus Gracilibacteria bacterium]